MIRSSIIDRTSPTTQHRHDDFLQDVCSGLSRNPKTLPCKYLYDKRGSRLFDLICETDEYYPTRTEMRIMQEHGRQMARELGEGCLLVEYGSGSSIKTRILLDYLHNPAGYIPIDISYDHLMLSASQLSDEYPETEIAPLCADYTQPLSLPKISDQTRNIAVYFPGSTIGNFHPREAESFLRDISSVCDAGGTLLIGVDLKKDHSLLNRAYNDTAGMTARFNLNLLCRMNDELRADFDLNSWEHKAFFNSASSRIEMHLLSLHNQSVRIGDHIFQFERGETIHTENSYKYSVKEFGMLAAKSGFRVSHVWTDPDNLFSVQSLIAS